MTRDFYSSVDVSSLATFTKVDLGANFDGQTLVNLAGVAVDLSFDGTNTHGQLAASGPTQALSWERHQRGAVWLKRNTGSGGGPLYVQVYAWKELNAGGVRL